MENLVMASKVLVDQSYLFLKKENTAFKKIVARRLFYHKINGLLRDINKKLIKCTCSNCTHVLHHNYPEGESRIVLTLHAADQNHNVDGSNAYQLSTMVFSDTDIFTNEERIGETCSLEAYFCGLCEKHGLPVPQFAQRTNDNKDHNENKMCLWQKLGHRQKKDENDLEDRCWRNLIARLSYSTQIQKLYKGLMHELICTLDAQDTRPISFVRKKNPNFEDWFRFNHLSLDLHDFDS